jgi:periplasmic copper chaperone A
MKKLIDVAALALVLAIASPAYAHVTVQPNEAVAGSFSRFVVRVPTEKNVPTTQVRLELPPLAFLAFEDKAGWQREEKVGEFDEPLEAFGQEITEGVVEVTWSGGEIGPEEFAEFGFSAALPESEETLEFKAYQTYRGGEVVEWTGGPESDAPAARLTTYELPAEEGQGQLAVLADLAERVEQVEAQAESSSDEETDAEPTPVTASEADGDEDDGSAMLGVILGGAGLLLGAIALLVALTRKKA